MTEVDLTALSDAGALVSHEHQDLIASLFGASTPMVDPAGGTVVFDDRDGARRTVRAHFLGTSSPTDGTWLWGWENINGFPDPFVRQVRRVRAFGQRHGIDDFTTATLPLDDELPLRLVRAVKAVTGITAHLSTPTGTDETRAWVLLDDPAFALPEPTAVRAAGVVTTVNGATIADHRRALAAWAAQRGAQADDRGEQMLIRLTDGVLRVRFDGDGRIAGITTRLGPDAERIGEPPVAAAPPPAPEVPPAVTAPAQQPQRRGWFARLLGGR